MKPFRTFYYHYTWNLQASPDEIWPMIADTNRYNRDTGVPPLIKTGEGHIRNARRRLSFRQFGILLEWEEDPFNWVYPHSIEVNRHYSRGPMAEMRVLVTMEPGAEKGTHMSYEMWITPRGLLGRVGIPFQIGLLSAPRFKAVIRGYDRKVTHPAVQVSAAKEAHLAPGGKLRLAEISRKLAKDGFDSEMVGNLAALLEKGDDMDLAELRPYAMADLWKRPRRKVLEFFLHATRQGMLEFRWETLCPHCRKSPEEAGSLSDVTASQYCPSCNLDYAVDFDQNIELVFRPNPAIRPIRAGEKFCVAGPQTTPHILVQQLLAPGSRCAIQPELATGEYRLRVLEQPGSLAVRVEPEGKSEAVFCLGTQGWEGQYPALSPAPRLEFENDSPDEQLFILERSAWNGQATSAVDVTSLQTFRDLFAAEALRPNEPISVGSLTIVFTDLRGSTRLYREIGDAPAFGSVMEHFDVLRDEIAAAGGSIVKTMGDAVMAVFPRPVEAVRAMRKAQNRLAAPSQGERPFRLKVAIQYGPVIAINANGRLDYFGSQVNQAARMVELSHGEDMILSESVMRDEEVIAEMDASLWQAEQFNVALRGFDNETFRLWRVRNK